VVLDTDYFACPDEQIKDIKVLVTICGGRVAYAAG
jgi:predicted amidohydrolase YtcJ